MAEELLARLDEDTVDFAPNYKESTTEPTVLPSALPNLLLNGSTGIAVGMTTNIPPHNLDEIIDATCAIIDRPTITIDEIVRIIPGPDFPTGGIIAGREGIVSYLHDRARHCPHPRQRAHRGTQGRVRANHHHRDPLQR
ncbi:MAG: DNA gyrase subunit A [Nibricoccus sp.]